MSVRAHRVIKIKTEPVATFNLWSDNGVNIVNHLNLFNGMNDDGGGLVELVIEEAEEMLAMTDEERGFTIEPDTAEALRKDINIEKGKGNNCIEYLCY